MQAKDIIGVEKLKSYTETQANYNFIYIDLNFGI